MFIEAKSLKLAFSDDLSRIGRTWLSGEELSGGSKPLFTIRLRDRKGEARLLDASTAKISAEPGDNSAVLTYRFDDLTAVVTVSGGERISWKLAVENHSDDAVEFIDFPSVSFAGKLRENGGDRAIVSPYNEGLLVEDAKLKPGMTDPEYPSQGSYMMFPYMVFAQFTLYLAGKGGVYMGVHDIERAPKGIDFCCCDDQTEFRTRLFMGGEFGEDVGTPETVWQSFEGGWQDGAELYRDWLAESFDEKPLSELDLPDWYKNDLPLVITYPVRGIHDMDEMTPNKLFPYNNVLPFVDEFAERTGSRIMVLLMHWEGTAPWAPPYVFPPFGGIEMFNDFMNELHKRGDLLGVYCSGLGFTEQSNLIGSYNTVDMIFKNRFDLGFCRAPDQSLPHSKICTGQRSGYDICPASETGKRILDDALEPLLDSGVDYVQALDQNHGGGMYFCYAKDHGHPPVPGKWMTKASRELLDGWKSRCPNTLLGCESAAAEPYIGDLRLSDNRYELCYMLGRPVPLYAYLFHGYLRNFMGNQVCCPLEYTTELLELRLAYSFLAGDMLTLVLNDEGEVMFHWGMRDFSKTPDRDEIISFVAELQRWHRVYPELFADARMIKPLGFDCPEIILDMRWGRKGQHESSVLTTAWQVGERRVQLLVNYTHEPRECVFADAIPGARLRMGEKVSDFDGRLVLPPLGVAAVEF